MKTAEELFDEHSEELELYSNCGGFMGLQRFKDALTEHDKEIVSLIDGMINKARKEIEVSEDSSDIFADSYLVEQLTELKERINK